MVDKDNAFILWFDQIGIEDVPRAGGKNASLGEMYKNLTPKGVKVPNGFAITAKAYWYFLDRAGIRDKIKEVLNGLKVQDLTDLKDKGKKVREVILNAEFPQELKDQIVSSYYDLCGGYNQGREPVDVAVRSSATAEDLADASFAGQQETYLNIRGHDELLIACKKCVASLFTDRAISYREDKKFSHFDAALSIGIQKMVRSDKACSGVMFSLDTESGFKDVVFITGAYGLGENVVQGAVNPDEFYVFKPTLRHNFRSIITKKLGEKKIRMVYTNNPKKPVKNVNTTTIERHSYCLNDDEVLTLAKYAVAIEDHYSAKAGHHKPMDMEWAKDGETGELFIVQARPETVHSQKDVTKLREYLLQEKGKVLIQGKSVGARIGAGKANVIKDVKGIKDFKAGEVLVTDMTDPDWEPIMKIASAIVTNRGGRTCHAAIISRELGIPCVVGTQTGTQKIPHGVDVTADCSQGDLGFVYEGILKFEIHEEDISNMPATKTHIMMNVGNPDQCFEASFIPNEGVGLAREEFIINSYIKIHPLALIHYDKLKNKTVKNKIESLTAAYKDKQVYYIDTLAQGIGKICAAFYPKKVIVRMADFKSNEYANLIGGTEFEPKEDNPMIGWRGASRYYSDNYKAAFRLECEAFKKVFYEYGLKNMVLMVPFCRTIEEGKKVLHAMEENGFRKGQDGISVIAMCEIPSNVILAEEFLELFDGFSIGSNDLTQLTLGLDRDSEIVSHIYDERNPAVKKLIKQVIEVCNAKGKYIGICGQAPSDYDDFAQFLVECGIQSISLISL
ncbi:MAG: phosphoenolpyruvate synthase [Nanoarchaeota archaeon]|nr:phosphoenolpyruvate synthase [Nanoarchaeota archaeon]